MKIVEPIRDRKQIDQIKGNLYRQSDPRDFLLFVFGINSGLRIGDLLSLKLGDVKGSGGGLKNDLDIKEQKTGKTRKVFFNKQIKEAISYYLKKTDFFDLDRYLFTNEKSRENKPITRVRAYQLINKWCKDVGLNCRVGG
ncbi:unnamed protein product, partial [marine sediment metagenome]